MSAQSPSIIQNRCQFCAPSTSSLSHLKTLDWLDPMQSIACTPLILHAMPCLLLLPTLPPALLECSDRPPHLPAKKGLVLICACAPSLDLLDLRLFY
jgi:hypothetical protein